MQRTIPIMAILLICCGIGKPARADNFWISAGGGYGSSGIAGGNNLSVRKGAALGSFRLILNLKDNFSLSRNPVEFNLDISALAGLATDPGAGGSLSFSLGPSIVHGVRRGNLIRRGFIFEVDEYEKETFASIGLALQAQIYASSSFGLLGFGNINQEESFGGLLLCIRFEF